MPQQDYDYVDFMQHNSETDKMESVCRVYLTDGKLFYEGEHAEDVKKAVKESDVLAPFRKLNNPYSLLRAMSMAFSGTYFYATNVKEPYSDSDSSQEEGASEPVSA